METASYRTLLLRLTSAGLLASIASIAAWYLTSSVNFPAFNTSYVLRALATAGSVTVVVAAAIIAYNWHRASLRTTGPWGWIWRTILTLAPTGLVITSTTIPLATTRLYLDGISVDNEFRTQYITRLADSLNFGDMNYFDMPSFYPGLWFFGGGLFARITGLDGWAAYQPWALLTIGVTAALLVVVWERLTHSLPMGAAVALATTAVTLVVAPEEPYAAIVAMAMPAALILAWRAFIPTTPNKQLAATIATVLYLGLSANLYTLYTGAAALSVVMMGCTATYLNRSIRPLLRLTLIGTSSLAIAAIGWGPYLFDLLTRPRETSKAQHYLPEIGTELPTPFLESFALFALSCLALAWFIWHNQRREAQALTIGILTCYLWSVLSMVAALAGTTLLGFRMAAPIAILLTTAGVLAIPDITRLSARTSAPASTRTSKTTTLVAILSTMGTLSYTTLIPHYNEEKLDLAYTDNDGSGHRGDRYPADATVYYQQINHLIQQHITEGTLQPAQPPAADFTGKTSTHQGIIILTDETNFLAYYPYNGFQAITAHYANPIGQYQARNEAIESWTKATSPDELINAIDTTTSEHNWAAPQIMILRGQLDLAETPEELLKLDATAGEYPTTTGPGTGNYTYRLAEDMYPSNPNVRFRTLQIPASNFAKHWNLTQIGPFVIAIRQQTP